MTCSIEVPDLVAQRARSSGSVGHRWLDDLPDVLAELARRWDLRLDRAFGAAAPGSWWRAPTARAHRSR